MLINAVKLSLNSPESRVILWGSGHGASLATWAKREFDELIQGICCIIRPELTSNNRHLQKYKRKLRINSC